MTNDRILFNTRDGIGRGLADGDATDDEVLFEKKCWRWVDWIGETTAGVLTALPIRMSIECSAVAWTSATATAASETDERAATRS